MPIGRVRSLGILRTGDPALDRVQDHVKQQIDPVLQNPVLSAVDFRWIEVQGADPTKAPTFALQYRSASTQGAPLTWNTVASFDSAGHYSGVVAGAWTSLPYLTGWGDANIGGAGAYYDGAYRLVTISSLTWLELRGAVLCTDNTKPNVATLPSTFRPLKNIIVPLPNSAHSEIELIITSAGTLAVNGTPVTGAGSWHSLGGIRFQAEA